jgi:hypothetical protein
MSNGTNSEIVRLSELLCVTNMNETVRKSTASWLIPNVNETQKTL